MGIKAYTFGPCSRCRCFRHLKHPHRHRSTRVDKQLTRCVTLHFHTGNSNKQSQQLQFTSRDYVELGKQSLLMQLFHCPELRLHMSNFGFPMEKSGSEFILEMRNRFLPHHLVLQAWNHVLGENFMFIDELTSSQSWRLGDFPFIIRDL